jgi:hypothetical protein
MTSARLRGLLPVALLAVLTLAGCTNPDAPSTSTSASATGSSSPQNAGEPPAPPPPAAGAQAPLDVQVTPAKAIAGFAELYVNWTYRTLSEHQRTLAAMSVGAARLAEQQAAASSSADTTIARGHIWNSGQVVGVAGDLAEPGTWAIVTREQTGGSTQYEGLPASFHVTLARVARVPGGYAVSEWLPQS